jgi:hypothetical protein
MFLNAEFLNGTIFFFSNLFLSLNQSSRQSLSPSISPLPRDIIFDRRLAHDRLTRIQDFLSIIYDVDLFLYHWIKMRIE